ncbi:hypothetical protein SRIMM317S_05066 [Streptomyces rimosus subsp. rimosus]
MASFVPALAGRSAGELRGPKKARTAPWVVSGTEVERVRTGQAGDPRARSEELLGDANRLTGEVVTPLRPPPGIALTTLGQFWKLTYKANGPLPEHLNRV